MYNSGNSSKNVTGASVVDGTLYTVDIADDAVTADKLANSVNTDIGTGVTASTTAGDALPKAGGTMTGDTLYGDNVKAKFGTSADLQIYHDGGNSYISNESASVIIQNNSDNSQVIIKNDNGSGGLSDYFRANGTTGEVLLYHYGAAKLTTKSTGIDVTGILNVEKASLNGITTKNSTTTGATTGAGIGFNAYDGTAVTQLASAFVTSSTWSYGTYLAKQLNLTNNNSGGIRLATATADIDFHTGDATNSGLSVRRMGIDSGGNVMLKATTPIVRNASFASLTVDGNGVFGPNLGAITPDASLSIKEWGGISVSFYYGTNKVGSITNTSSATAYNTSSDYRLKELAIPMSGSIDRLKALKPINFAWKVDGTRTDGFLAHEAGTVVPEAVHGTKDAMKTEEYEVTPALGEVFIPAIEEVSTEQQVMETIEGDTYVNLAGETVTETLEVGKTIEVTTTKVHRKLIDGILTEVESNQVHQEPVMQTVVTTQAVAEVIVSSNVEKPETDVEGQQWREVTAKVMGEREVEDYQGIDQAKLVPLLVATVQELIAKVEALEAV